MSETHTASSYLPSAAPRMPVTWRQADLSTICDELALSYRLVGGNAVTFLTWIHGVNDLVPGRETADTDLGAELQSSATRTLP